MLLTSPFSLTGASCVAGLDCRGLSERECPRNLYLSRSDDGPASLVASAGDRSSSLSCPLFLVLFATLLSTGSGVDVSFPRASASSSEDCTTSCCLKCHAG